MQEGYVWETHGPLILSESPTFRTTDSLVWSARHRLLRLLALQVELGYGDSQHTAKQFRDCMSKDRIAGSLIGYGPSDRGEEMIDAAEHRTYVALCTEERATAVIIALHEYLKMNGEFPTYLDQLSDTGLDVSGATLYGFGNNTRFHYSPQGYGAAIPYQTSNGNLHVLNSSQPIMWTDDIPSPAALHLAFNDTPASLNYHEPTLVLFVNGPGMTITLDQLQDAAHAQANDKE